MGPSFTVRKINASPDRPPLHSIMLLLSDLILRVIGRQGAAVLIRVMGMILASLAVEIVLTALAVGSWKPA
ncbi:MAG: hypothetical protein H0W43_03300 [Chthoniobacterales bacterium]|nr:hypothetical protein [Chthoniobacterales bacterium]